MQTFNYEVQTRHGSATGSVEAKNEDSARKKLAEQYEGELVNDNGHSLSNSVKSIELQKVHD